MTPATEAELAEMISGLNGPVWVKGGGTRGLSGGESVLNTTALSGITLYEPGALTLVAGAGTPLNEVEAALAAENQRLAFEPMDHRRMLGTTGTPTLGGIVAGNISGPRRIQVGACRDHLLGVRFVDGGGQVIMNGGRVMKNVTGYDLVKLLCGSWGTLGVLSEVSLKVLPSVETEGTVVLHVSDVSAAVQAMSAALGTSYEVTGAAYGGQTPAVMIRVEGFEASVTYRLGKLRDAIGKFGELGDALLGEKSADAWNGVRDVSDLADRTGDIWKVSVKPGDAPGLIERIRPDAVQLNWGGGLIWALMPQDSDLRARAGAFSGHATLVRAVASTRERLGVFQPEPTPLARISAGLRARFDPKGVLNPGLMQSLAEA